MGQRGGHIEIAIQNKIYDTSTTFSSQGNQGIQFERFIHNLTNVKLESCDYENNTTFTYENIDKELVLILKSKVIPIEV